MFSIRNGHKREKVILLKDIDSELRTKIWNIIYLNYIQRHIDLHHNFGQTEWIKLFHDFFKVELNPFMSESIYSIGVFVKKEYDNFKWYEILDFIEYILQISSYGYQKEMIDELNLAFESEHSGYRIIDSIVTPITHEVEISEMEKALTHADRISEYLRTALAHYSSKTNPDYRNSIKESISAVESTCQMILNNRDTLGKALDKIKNSGINIPPSLEKGFDKIYGYTNAEDGIRHAMMDLPNLSEEDARFMLIASSAFTNYLLVKYEKIK